jgi:hypothetical protein
VHVHARRDTTQAGILDFFMIVDVVGSDARSQDFTPFLDLSSLPLSAVRMSSSGNQWNGEGK